MSSIILFVGTYQHSFIFLIKLGRYLPTLLTLHSELRDWFFAGGNAASDAALNLTQCQYVWVWYIQVE